MTNVKQVDKIIELDTKIIQQDNNVMEPNDRKDIEELKDKLCLEIEKYIFSIY